VAGQMEYYSRHATIMAQLLKKSSISSTLRNRIILGKSFAIKSRNFIKISIVSSNVRRVKYIYNCTGGLRIEE